MEKGSEISDVEKGSEISDVEKGCDIYNEFTIILAIFF